MNSKKLVAGPLAAVAMLAASVAPATAKPTQTCQAQNGMFPKICVSVTPLAEAGSNPNVAIHVIGASWYWKHHAMKTLSFGPTGGALTDLTYTPDSAKLPTYWAYSTAPTAGKWSLKVTMSMYNGLLKHVKTIPVTVR